MASAIQEFVDATGVTMPILGLAFYLQSPSSYYLQFDNYALVDADGIVRYTSQSESHGNPLGRFNDGALRTAIKAYLPTAVEARTWSALKGLYR